MNREAMRIPANRLIESLTERIESKRAILAEREKKRGENRIRIYSHLENLALPELFGFDMNRLFSDARLAIEINLRQRIFWLDNSLDDLLPGLDMDATVGMYYDMTLFGADIRHAPGGVPEFRPQIGRAHV